MCTSCNDNNCNCTIPITLSAGPAGEDGFGYNAVSTTSLATLDIPSTTAMFTMSSSKAYTPGARVRVSAQSAPTANYFEGIVTAYNVNTGITTVNNIDKKVGTGTINAWNINLAGEIGNAGTNGVGTPGSDGDDGAAGAGYNTSSVNTINLSVPILGGTITVEPNKAYSAGARIRVSATLLPESLYFEAVCTAYNIISGVLVYGVANVQNGTGVYSSWNVNVAGEKGNNGADGNIVYDSGWKVLNAYNGIFGLAPVANWTNPSIRVIGKTVFIKGRFLIPLGSDATPNILGPNAASYPTTYDIATYTGPSGGFQVNTEGAITSLVPIIPSTLAPSLLQSTGRNLHAQRAMTTSNGYNMVLSNYFNPVYLKTDGKILIVTHFDIDDTVGVRVKNDPIHMLITKANALERVPNFDSYKTSFTPLGASNMDIGSDAFTVYPVTVDGENPAKLGGYFFTLDMTYPVSTIYTAAQIKAAFDSI